MHDRSPFLKLSTQQIGKLGELLSQYQLLQYGIESAHLTTDAGIDLVAYSSSKSIARTIQVKANLSPKPAGGKGKDILSWWVPDDCPAELFAFVCVSINQVWMFSRDDLNSVAQQKSGGKRQFYMYTASNISQRSDRKPAQIERFDRFRLENNVGNLFF